MSGTETILIAMYEEPEWCVDMFNTSLDCCIRQFEKSGMPVTIFYWDA